MKSRVILLVLTLYSIKLCTQHTPHSLIGSYAGENWFKWMSDSSWTITSDTFNLYIADTNCHFSGCMTGFCISAFYQTLYSFCNYPVPDNYYTLFYAGDSMQIKYDNISQPPPNIHFFSQRFYGRQIDTIPYIIEEKQDESGKIIVYPIPAHDLIYIEAPYDHYFIELINMQGDAVLKSESFFRKISLPLSSLKAGMYVLRIFSDNINDAVFEKIIIE